MKAKNILIVFALMASFTAFAEVKIIGGKIAPIEPKSGIVNIITGGPAGELDWIQCTGTKISKRAILTAAHCFYKYKDTPLIVLFNNDVSNPDKNFGVLELEKIEIHPSYKGTDASALERATQSDLAILIVKETENFADFDDLNTLKINYSEIGSNRAVNIWGYGCQKPKIGDYNPEIFTKQTATGTTLEQDVLLNIRGTHPDILKTHAQGIYLSNFVTSGNKRNSTDPSICSGDSGGPVTVNNEVIGVNSISVFNDVDSEGNIVSGISYINLHSRLSKMQDWIKKVIK